MDQLNWLISLEVFYSAGLESVRKAIKEYPKDAVVKSNKEIKEYPKDAVVKSKKEILGTDARVALLKEDYHTDKSIELILHQFNTLPGKQVSLPSLYAFANKLGLRRPPPTPPIVKQPIPQAIVIPPHIPPVAAPPSPKMTRTEVLMVVSKAVVKKDMAPQPAPFLTIRKWAGERGVEFETWIDLARVNHRRNSLGLPPFSRE